MFYFLPRYLSFWLALLLITIVAVLFFCFVLSSLSRLALKHSPAGSLKSPDDPCLSWSALACPGLVVNCIFTPNCNADENANATHGIAFNIHSLWQRLVNIIINISSTSSGIYIIISSIVVIMWALALALSVLFFGFPFMPETLGVCLSLTLCLSLSFSPFRSLSAGQWIALIRFHFMTIISTIPNRHTQRIRGTRRIPTMHRHSCC